MKKLIITMIAIAFSLSAFSEYSANADYRICFSSDVNKIEKCVVEYLDKGYKPHGSMVMSFNASHGYTLFTQPMVRK